MKLIQSIFLTYYSTKFKAIALLSLPEAAKSAFELFCTPYSRRKTYEVPEVFKQAEKLTFPFQNHEIQGFHWQPKTATKHKVLICHGFDSLSYKFERYIEPLLNNAFEVFAFDAPGHGVSSGKTINALLYRNMILEVLNRYGPFNSIMAHSFGGIAAALAIEELKDDLPKRLVLIAPATETTRSVDDFCRHLKINKPLRKALEDLIIQIGGQPASWYSVARIVQSISVPTLWLHDTDDRITPYEDMKYLQKLNLPHAEFVITQGLGHSLYRHDEVANRIIAFLSAMKAGDN